MRRQTRATILAMAGFPLLLAAPAATGGEPEIVVTAAQTDIWRKHDATSTVSINYQVIDDLLKVFVLPNGRGRTAVPYTRLSGQGQRVLENLIAEFEKIPIQAYNRNEQLAYWLNLRTMILLHQSIEGHQSIKPRDMIDGPMAFTKRKLVTIAGQSLSVVDIDAIMLTIWPDAHVVYGLAIPAKGSPALPLRAYRGAEVHDQLREAGRTFVNRSDTVKVKKGTALVSSFLLRHRKLLGSDDAALLSHVRSLAEPKLAARLTDGLVIGERFDWALNAFVERSFDSVHPQGFGNAGSGAEHGGGS